jgi:hypothetical protein
LQVPAPSQRSSVQETPSLVHDVVEDAFVHADVLVAGWHVWQELAGFAAPFARQTPEMRQLPDASVCVQVPAPSQRSFVHERPSLVHVVLLERLVQADVEVDDAHHWQPFTGLTVAFV